MNSVRKRLFDALDHFLLHRFHFSACGRPRRAPCPRAGSRAPLRRCSGFSFDSTTAMVCGIFILEIVGEHLFLNVGELLPTCLRPAGPRISSMMPVTRSGGAGYSCSSRSVPSKVPISAPRLPTSADTNSRQAGPSTTSASTVPSVDITIEQFAHFVVVEQRPDLAAILLTQPPASGIAATFSGRSA